MSLQERASKAVEGAKRRLSENKIVSKAIFTYNMGFNNVYREGWLKNHVTQDLSQGSLTIEQSDRILEQASRPQTSRHFGETFAIPLISYAVAGISSACIAYYALETNDPLAWGYTLSHFAQGMPKLSISSGTRAGLLALSIGYDHIQDRQVGSWKRITGELAAVTVSGISWVGTGNAGPIMRMGVHSADFRGYLSEKVLKRKTSKGESDTSVAPEYMVKYGFTSLPRIS